MREIKFRAFDQEKLIYNFDIMSQEKHKSEQFGKYNNGFEIPIMSDIGIIDIMQFSGVVDINGKEIYEGDIVENFAIRDMVIFDKGIFTTKMSQVDKFGVRQPLSVHTELKVIGNKIDNPELLKHDVFHAKDNKVEEGVK